MIEVAAAVTTIGVLLWVAIGAVARADGVMPKPGEHVDLVVDHQFLRDPPRRVGNATVVLEDHFDLAARDGRTVLRQPQLDRRVDLLAGRRLLAGHGQDEADLERRAALGLHGTGERGCGDEGREAAAKGKTRDH